jgi:hypothetical protein
MYRKKWLAKPTLVFALDNTTLELDKKCAKRFVATIAYLCWVVERRSVQVVITANENYTWERFPTNQEPDIHYQSDNDEKSLEIYQLELN